MEPIIFGMAVMSLISYFVQLMTNPNISLMEILFVSISGGIVLRDSHKLIKKILKK